MEKSVKYVLAGVVICLGIVLSSCGKDDNEIIPGGIVNVDGEWKCRMNGEPYELLNPREHEDAFWSWICLGIEVPKEGGTFELEHTSVDPAFVIRSLSLEKYYDPSDFITYQLHEGNKITVTVKPVTGAPIGVRYANIYVKDIGDPQKTYKDGGEPQKTFVVGGLCFFQDGR